MARLALSFLALLASANGFASVSEEDRLGQKMFDNFIALQTDVAQRDESTAEAAAASMNHITSTYFDPEMYFHMWEVADQNMLTWRGREGVRAAYSQVWNHLNGGLPDLEEIVQTNADLSIIFIWNYETGGILEAATFVKYTPDANYIVHIFENYDGAPQADMVQDYSCCLIGP
mmetsp:Transcript_3543/g.6772  ORF Transcript_3543/g.6772 Transcript_3543/m.6772 type:complete len:174 (+) Transcript_3543:74-595(+)